MTVPKKSPNPFTPLYRRLVDAYIRAIQHQELKPGEKIDSITQIQGRYRVSRETAKQVLRILAHEGYIIQKAGKGSFVADVRPKEKIWAIILPFHSMQYEELVREIGYYAWKQGRKLEYYVDQNNWQEEIRLVGMMITNRYEAVVVVPTLDESKTAEFYSRLSHKETFVTLVDHTMTGSFFRYVIQSYDLGVTRAMNYLLCNTAGGSVAFVRSETWSGRNLVQETMESTYLHELNKFDATMKPVIIDHVHRFDPAIISKSTIRGIFCCDDTDAVRVLGRCAECRISVPADVRLVSYGNTDIARYFTPAISSIDPRNKEMAGTISSIIGDHLTGKNTELCQYVVQPELIQRET